MTELLIQTVLALAFVVFIIYMFAFVYKKRSRRSGLIDIVAYQSLGQRMGIAAVKIGGEILVIGITPTDFRLLKKMQEGAVAAITQKEPEGEAAGPSGSARWFRELILRRKSGNHMQSGSMAEKIEKLRRMKEELNG